MTEPTDTKTTRDTLERTYEQARDAAGEALTKTRDKAREVARKAGDDIGDFPMAVLAGGAAIGALLGSLIPATLREREMLGKTGKRLNAAAIAAAKAARDTGKQELDSLGLNKDTAGREANRLIEGVVKAVSNVGSAAAEAAKQKAKK
ncbi:hypothetical protein ACFO8O_03335 [Hephaestia sp. GCM10023244]|uniref:hypothetical protein n=1 Tax=unclassified Hephaestia TaxID=2631281 RepID=UPI0020770211|nr:hypothetical protein [Hephaestia sp. MAHUQ-44]MCM8730002.1 hypothetical protein [Hephaestia sp. MAHUQ-44]